MPRLLIALVLALCVSTASAQGSENVTTPLSVHWLQGGQIYCKGSLVAADLSGLCYLEYTLADFQGLRLGVGNRFDFHPEIIDTAVLFLDYTADTWFVGAEVGRVIYGPGTWKLSTYFGFTIP